MSNPCQFCEQLVAATDGNILNESDGPSQAEFLSPSSQCEKRALESDAEKTVSKKRKKSQEQKDDIQEEIATHQIGKINFDVYV